MRRWWGRQGWPVLAAAALVGACAAPAPSASVAPAQSGSDAPTSASPSLAEAWELVHVEPGGTLGDLVVVAASAGPTRVVITGQIAGPAADPIGHPEPRAWYSVDGEAWHRSEIVLGDVDSPVAFEIGTLFSVGDRLYGFGQGFESTRSDRVVSVLFESMDEGASWNQVSDAVLPRDGTVRDVVAGGPGYVAVGAAARSQEVGIGKMIWTSRDGRSWEPATQGDGSGVIGLGYFNAIANHGGLLMAVGPSFASGHSGIWTSSNGLHWVETPAVAGVNGNDVIWAGAWLVVGDGPSAGQPSSQVPVVERSEDDGATWQRDPLPAGDARSVWRVVATPAGLLAVGDRIDHALAWVSSDGLTWEIVELPHGSQATGVTSIFFRDRLLIAGEGRNAANDTLPLVWLSPRPL